MNETTTETGRVITDADLKALQTVWGAWDRKTLEALGVPWPPPAGWKRALVGKPLPDAAALLLSSLKEQNRPEDDGVIWVRAYTTVREGWYAYVIGPEGNIAEFRGDPSGLDAGMEAEGWAQRLNVAYNAGRRAARLGRQ